MLRAFFLFTILAISRNASAFNCMHRGLQKQLTDLVVPVAVHDEDGRRFETGYAKAKGVDPQVIKNRYAATGTIECGDYTGSAALVGDTGTIVTVGHMLYKREDCTFRSKAQDCTFRTVVNGQDVESKISSLVDMGFNCPQPGKPSEDWAVMKLKTKLNEVNHYRLPKLDPGFDQTKKMLAVNGRNEDVFRKLPSGEKFYPKTLEDCVSRKPYRSGGNVKLFESNCDSALGTSGSSVVEETDEGDVITALTIGNYEDEKDLWEAVKAETVNTGTYVPGKWGSVHIPIAGKVLEAIREGNKRLR